MNRETLCAYVVFGREPLYRSAVRLPLTRWFQSLRYTFSGPYRSIPGPVVALVALGGVPMVVRLLRWQSALDLVALLGTAVAIWALAMRPWREGPANVDFLAEAMSLMAAGFVVVDRGGYVTKVNRTFCELFGVHSDRDVRPGMTACSLFSATGAIGSGSLRPEENLAELEVMLRSDDFVRGTNIERRDGRSLAMTSVPLRVGDHCVSIAVFWDDTQWSQAQQEGRAARYDAERGRSAAMSMVRLASHEIRGPVHAMLVFMDLLGATNLDSHQATLLSSAYDAGAGLRGVVDRILDLSMLESGAVMVAAERMDLWTTVREVSAVVSARLAAKSVRFDVMISDDLPTSRIGDAVRINQVLTNLLVNATKFTSTGVVSLTVRPACEGWVKFVVSDTGPGIPAEVLNQVFHDQDTAFVRSEGGSGMGLLITRQLVELMEGTITAVSSAKEGTVFVVDLPLPEADLAVMQSLTDERGVTTAIPALAVVASGTVEEPGWPLVLVVDDSADVLEVMAQMLRRLGAAVDTTTDPFQAVHWCTTRLYDLVVIDAMMPGLDGPTTARTIRLNEEDTRVPILIATGEASAAMRKRCAEAGVNAFLVKPFSTKELGDVVSGLVGERPGALAGLTQFSTDQAELIGAVGMFLDRLDARLGLVNDAVRRLDAPATASAAHNLASAAAMFGVKALARSCRDLERRARNGVLDEDSAMLLADINSSAVDAAATLRHEVAHWQAADGWSATGGRRGAG